MAARKATESEGPGWRIVSGAFHLASRSNGQCRPIHLLYALAEDGGAIGEALHVFQQDPPSIAQASGTATSTFLFMQTQGAAVGFASSRTEPLDAPHLLVALLDQPDPEVGDALTVAAIDVPALRRTALGLLGAPTDLPAIAMPPLTPAGTMDRPALDVAQLDPRAWRVLTWRRDHLPLDRIRRSAHAYALRHVEQDEASRIADRAGVDDDQRYSLLVQHLHEVDQRLAQRHPDWQRALASSEEPVDSGFHAAGDAGIARRPWSGRVPLGSRRHRRLRFAVGWLGFTVGWGTWFRNRQVGMRDRWFRFSTRSAYRGQPPLNT